MSSWGPFQPLFTPMSFHPYYSNIFSYGINKYNIAPVMSNLCWENFSRVLFWPCHPSPCIPLFYCCKYKLLALTFMVLQNSCHPNPPVAFYYQEVLPTSIWLMSLYSPLNTFFKKHLRTLSHVAIHAKRKFPINIHNILILLLQTLLFWYKSKFVNRLQKC